VVQQLGPDAQVTVRNERLELPLLGHPVVLPALRDRLVRELRPHLFAEIFHLLARGFEVALEVIDIGAGARRDGVHEASVDLRETERRR
jgi:hypothetical protein